MSSKNEPDLQPRDTHQERKTPGGIDSGNSGTIEDAIRRFRVCYEIWPEQGTVGGLMRQIGFALELSGTHEPGILNPEAGCVHCREIFVALERIAASILPTEARDSRYEIGPYDHAIHHASGREGRPDVVLTIRIFHREELDRPPDPCQRRCLEEMVRRLHELGAEEARWRRRSDPQRPA